MENADLMQIHYSILFSAANTSVVDQDRGKRRGRGGQYHQISLSSPASKRFAGGQFAHKSAGNGGLFWNQWRTASFDKDRGGKRWVSKADRYQKLAAECLLLAKTANDRTNRALLLKMAQTWLQLAERELIANTESAAPSDT